MTQPSPEYDEAYENYEAWRDLQDVLEERDAEWWAEQDTDDDRWPPRQRPHIALTHRTALG